MKCECKGLLCINSRINVSRCVCVCVCVFCLNEAVLSNSSARTPNETCSSYHGNILYY